MDSRRGRRAPDPVAGPLPEDDCGADRTQTRRASAYCSATDRNVPVLIRMARKRRPERPPSYQDARGLVCLDYGRRCTGWLCPLFDVPALPDEGEISDPARPGFPSR